MSKSMRVELDLESAIEVIGAQLNGNAMNSIQYTQFGRVLVDAVPRAVDPVRVYSPDDAPNTRSTYDFRKNYDHYIQVVVPAVGKDYGRINTLVTIGMMTVMLRHIVGGCRANSINTDNKYVMAMTKAFLEDYCVCIYSDYKPEKVLMRKEMRKAGIVDYMSTGYKTLIAQKAVKAVNDVRDEADRIIKEAREFGNKFKAECGDAGWMPLLSDFYPCAIFIAYKFIESDAVVISASRKNAIRKFISECSKDGADTAIFWVNLAKICSDIIFNRDKHVILEE